MARAELKKTSLPPPSAGDLVHGDLLWPKGKHAIIPYFWNNETSVTENQLAAEKADWEVGQARFRAEGKPDSLTQGEFEYLASLTFERFRARYGLEPHGVGPGAALLGGLVSVGHVAIVEVLRGEPFIIEALMKQGVVRRPYESWAKDHARDLVWWGRLKGPVADAPGKFVAAARAQVGKPYDFWNFDLSDDRGFYCSKLVWFAAFKVFGIALDGDPDPRRGFWYSPRQLTHSRLVDMLQSAGAYGRP